MYIQLLKKLLNNIIIILIALIVFVVLTLAYSNRESILPGPQGEQITQSETDQPQSQSSSPSLHFSSQVIGEIEKTPEEEQEHQELLDEGVLASDPTVLDGQDGEVPEGFQPGVLLIPDGPATPPSDDDKIIVGLAGGSMSPDSFEASRGEGLLFRFESADDEYTVIFEGISPEEVISAGRGFAMNIFIAEDYPDDEVTIIVRQNGSVVDTGVIEIQ